MFCVRRSSDLWSWLQLTPINDTNKKNAKHESGFETGFEPTLKAATVFWKKSPAELESLVDSLFS